MREALNPQATPNATPSSPDGWRTLLVRATWAVLPWTVVWLTLSALSTVTHFVTWRSTSGVAQSLLGEWAGKVLANLVIVPTSAGWIVVTNIHGGLDPHSVRFAIAANLLGWIPWLLLAWVLLRAWRRVRRRVALGRATRGVQPSAAGGYDRPASPDRRRFLVDAAFAAPVAASAGLYGHASVVAPFSLRVTRVEFPIGGLPQGLHGLRCVVIGDTHFGSRIPSGYLRNAFEQALDLRPDLFLLVGDYVHYAPTFGEESVELLKPLLDTGRAIAILGNHDNYYGQGPYMLERLRDAGAHLVVNDRVYIEPGTRAIRRTPLAEGLCIAGLADHINENPASPVDVGAALRDVPANMPTVLLAHSPDLAEDQRVTKCGRRLDLILSGHTHGGQVKLPLLGTPIVPSSFGSKYAYGLNQGPVCPVLTTSGVGVSILPLRINVPPEIVELTLVSAPPAARA